MATRHVKPKRRRSGTGTDSGTPYKALGLTVSQYEFCLHYLKNGFNAAAAYKASHPAYKSDPAARVGGSTSLTHPNVKQYLAPRLAEHWQGLHMGGDEALARVGLDARADPRQLFDATGHQLGPHEWPDDLANSIESVELKADGTFKIKLASKGNARRTILEVTSKVRGESSIDQLVEAMKDTIEKNQGKKR